MTQRITGWARRERNRRILAESDICHICGEPGADSIDHIVALARGGTEHRSNLAPAHHYRPNSQGIKCNMAKAARAYAPVVRRSGALL